MADVSSPDHQAQAATLRQSGIMAAEAGQESRARRYLRQSIALDDGVEETWLWLAKVASTPEESLSCLQRAWAINPDSPQVQRPLIHQHGLDRLPKTSWQTISPKTSLPNSILATGGWYRWQYWVGAVLVVWLLVLVTGGFLLASLGVGGGIPVLSLPTPTRTSVPATSTPTTLERVQALHAPLQAAWESGDWSESALVLDQIQALDSDYGGLDAWLIAVHLAWGVELANTGQPEEALAHFDTVLDLDPQERTAQEQRQLALNYLAAQESYAAGDWEGATSKLRIVLDVDSDYGDAGDLLYRSYYHQGRAFQIEGELQAAKEAYEEAWAIRGAEGGGEAQAALAHVTALLTPPTPTPIPKRIEIYIGQQRMHVYEGDNLIWNWVVSTGEPGRPTRTGHFQVLDKIPNAYAVRWDLQMPYWLGIYYVGPSENGIHALPILSNGQRLWAGFLGQRVSYGCVILGVEEARLLYEWAEVGTPVDIYP